MKKKWPIFLSLLFILLLARVIFAIDIRQMFVFILFISGVYFLVKGLFGGKFGKNTLPKQSELPPALSREKEQHYAATGMTASEVKFFRDTMNQTKNQIEMLQVNMNRSAKLKAIDLRYDTLRAAKGIFKELVKEPNKLSKANHFLYTHLPNLVDLTAKYDEINNHEIKNKQTYEKLEESAQIIDQLAQLIAADYQEFVADDLDDIDVEISVAKQSIKRNNSSITESVPKAEQTEETKEI